VLGPTQITLKNYVFTEPIDFAFLDGPHGYPFVELEYYFVYPHLRSGGLLILDDIHIPTIFRMFEFLKEDKMFALNSVVENTAVFLRTDTETLNPLHDGWWLQEFNKKRFPVVYQSGELSAGPEERASSCNWLSQELQARVTQISQLQADLRKLQGELSERINDGDRLRQQIDSLHGSICWRLTWPIRWLHKQANRARSALSKMRFP